MSIDSTAATSSAPSTPPHEEHPLVGRNVVWGLAAGGSSTVVHLALLLVLGLIIERIPKQTPIMDLTAAVEEKREPVDLPEKLSKEIIPAEKLIPPSPHSPSQGAAHLRRTIGTAVASPKLTSPGVDRFDKLSIAVGVNHVLSLSSSSLAAPTPDQTLGNPGEAAASIEAAMDRITQEILNKLVRRKVLLVWIFDQSESMQDDREEITGRVDRVYEELGLTAVSKGNALLTAVTSYGADVAVHTPSPTADRAEIIRAINAVPIDPSGEEKMCRAVTFSIAQFQRFAQQQDRQLMCVLVTDESGDQTSNFTDLEQTIQTAAAARAPIYVLGREAVFGYPYAHTRWIDPETKYQAWIRIDRGPESPYPEQLQVDGFHRRFDAHPSGFGPYEQSRMARQTGGVFFMLPSPETNLVGRDTREYDPDSMRAYLPDLSARDAYAAERDKYPMRAMLWKVITDLNPYDEQRKHLVQVRLHNWPIDREAYAREAETNVKKAQSLIQYFAQAQQALEGVSKLRDRDPSLRWRANYDIAYAQTIAYQARLHDYIAYVGGFVKNPKPIRNELGNSRPTNEWNAALVKRTLIDDAKVAALRDRSTELYRKVAKDHPGTPWAARAELELARPFGLEFREGHEDARGRAGVKIPHH